jgi:hypothetical protein
MRRTCQVYIGAELCGKPAADCVEVDAQGAHLCKFKAEKDETTLVWMCPEHLDNWMKIQSEK